MGVRDERVWTRRRMYEVLRCVDRWGREIVLTDGRWYGKILLDHPQLTGALGAVKETLIAPSLINYDRIRDDVEIFYREVVLPPPFGRSLLKACIHFAAAEGYVLTAYTTVNINPGEVRKWP
jgi:hypothetical protein